MSNVKQLFQWLHVFKPLLFKFENNDMNRYIGVCLKPAATNFMTGQIFEEWKWLLFDDYIHGHDKISYRRIVTSLK